MRKLSLIILSVFLLSIATPACKPRLRGSKALEKRKRKLKRKYKRSGIDDCPVFDCRIDSNQELINS